MRPPTVVNQAPTNSPPQKVEDDNQDHRLGDIFKHIHTRFSNEYLARLHRGDVPTNKLDIITDGHILDFHVAAQEHGCTPADVALAERTKPASKTLSPSKLRKNFCPECGYVTQDHECPPQPAASHLEHWKLHLRIERREQEQQRQLRDASIVLSDPSVLVPSQLLKKRGGYSDPQACERLSKSIVLYVTTENDWRSANGGCVRDKAQPEREYDAECLEFWQWNISSGWTLRRKVLHSIKPGHCKHGMKKEDPCTLCLGQPERVEVDYLVNAFRCKHPNVREFTFSDGSTIKLCPDCSIPFTSTTESLNSIDAHRRNVLMGRSSISKAEQVKMKHTEQKWEEKLEAEGLPPIALLPRKQTKKELEAIEAARAGDQGKVSPAKNSYRASQIRKEVKPNTEAQRNCEGCGVLFVPNKASRTHCYDPNCRKRQSKRKKRSERNGDRTTQSTINRSTIYEQ